MVYENNNCDQNSLDRFHVEVLFSPGLYPCFLTEKERIYEKRFNSHKTKTPNTLNNDKMSKNSNTKSSGDQTEKESTDTEANLPKSSSNRSNELCGTCSDDSSTTPNYERTLLASTSKQPSPTASNKNPSNPSGNIQKADEDIHDSDDELADQNAVNLVVLGEVAGKKYSRFID